MRSLERNKQKFYYALYQGVTEATDSNGDYTGEQTITYGTPTAMYANIAPANGTAIIEQFGVDSRYTRLISTTDMGCPLDLQSVLWIDTTDTTAPPGFKVVGIRRSINSLVIIISEIHRGGANA